jgi:hypothetical protein
VLSKHRSGQAGLGECYTPQSGRNLTCILALNDEAFRADLGKRSYADAVTKAFVPSPNQRSTGRPETGIFWKREHLGQVSRGSTRVSAAAWALAEPKHDPAAGLWSADSEVVLSCFVLGDHGLNGIRQYSLSDAIDDVALFESTDYDLEAGLDGEDVFRDGTFRGWYLL